MSTSFAANVLSYRRELPEALAYFIAKTKLNDPRLVAYNRIFQNMTPAQQLQCRELLRFPRRIKP